MYQNGDPSLFISKLSLNYKCEAWRSSTVERNVLTLWVSIDATDLIGGCKSPGDVGGVGPGGCTSTWNSVAVLDCNGPPPVATNAVLSPPDIATLGPNFVTFNAAVAPGGTIYLRWDDRGT